MEEIEIHKALEAVGLSKNEVTVYLDLLRAGKSSAMEISKRAQLHRSNTYDILEKLLEKGIVDESIEDDKMFFCPIDPKDLLDYARQKESKLKEIIPELEKFHNKTVEESRVYISKGLNSVKNLLNHLLEVNKPVFIYGTPKEATEILGGFIEDWNKTRIEKKISLKHIYGTDSMKRIKELNEMNFTEARFLPESFNSKVSTNICGNKVVIVLWDIPISAIVIESESVAESYRKKFDILWEVTDSMKME